MAFVDDERGAETFFILSMMCLINAYIMEQLGATHGAVILGIFGVLSASISSALMKDGWNRRVWNTIMGVF